MHCDCKFWELYSVPTKASSVHVAYPSTVPVHTSVHVAPLALFGITVVAPVHNAPVVHPDAQRLRDKELASMVVTCTGAPIGTEKQGRLNVLQWQRSSGLLSSC